jgi:hypothetical protein
MAMTTSLKRASRPHRDALERRQQGDDRNDSQQGFDQRRPFRRRMRHRCNSKTGHVR